MTEGQLYAAVFEFVISARNDPDLLNDPGVSTAVNNAITALKALKTAVDRAP